MMERKKANTLEELLKDCPQNLAVLKMFAKTWTVVNDPLYERIACKISGGSDSDVMLDAIWRCDKENKVTYVWFDTGLEYQATKDHLAYLETQYGIQIQREKAVLPIPLSVKKYGTPFINKRVSDYLERLQRHGFQWADEPYEQLIKDYPHCQTALKWWCNAAKSERFCIAHHKGLKEFLIREKPSVQFSCKCCEYAKKKVGDRVMNEGNFDLDIIGVRKSEGGPRATAYKSCFDRRSENWQEDRTGWDTYRPLFWLTNDDKRQYEEAYQITHSTCYTRYHLKRTGCAGCPFGRDIQAELEAIREFEPKFYAACIHTFGASYELTERYRKFNITSENSPASTGGGMNRPG